MACKHCGKSKCKCKGYSYGVPKVKGYYYGTDSAVPEFYAPVASPQVPAVSASQQLQGQVQGASRGEVLAQQAIGKATSKLIDKGLDKYFGEEEKPNLNGGADTPSPTGSEAPKPSSTAPATSTKAKAPLSNKKETKGFVEKAKELGTEAKDFVMGFFGSQEGTSSVPPMGYADGLAPIKPLHEQQKDPEFFEAEESGNSEAAELTRQLAEDMAVEATANAASAIPVVGPFVSLGIKGAHMGTKKARSAEKKADAEAKQQAAEARETSDTSPVDAVESVDVMDDSKVSAPLAAANEVLGKDDDILSQGFADGKESIDELMKTYREKMNAPTEATEMIRKQLRGQNTEATDKVRKELFKGYADGSRYAMEAAERSEMSPEEFQKKFLEERVIEPAKAFLEERAMLSAPLAAIAAGRAFEKGEMKLGKFKGGRLEGGRDRLAYSHPRFGDFEINPESERVSYKKTFRF